MSGGVLLVPRPELNANRSDPKLESSVDQRERPASQQRPSLLNMSSPLDQARVIFAGAAPGSSVVIAAPSRLELNRGEF